MTRSIAKILLFSIFGALFLSLVPAANAASDIPSILPRSEWTKNNESLEKLLTWMPNKNNNNPPDYYPIERIILHYTETPNTDNSKEVSIARIQAIYQYHAVTRGWGDIGYNYIIDRQGNIYQGRYGENGVRAAHAFNSITRDNHNVGTIGIALLGNYSSENPPEAMFSSLKKLVGWLAAANGFEPDASKESKIWNEKQQGFTTMMNLPRVISHKDIDSTHDSGIPASKFNELRTDSQSLYNEYKTYLYQLSGQASLYEISNGVRVLTNTAEGNTAVISQSQLELFPLVTTLKHPDSTLIKTNNSGIAFLEGGYKRPIMNPEIFTSRFNWSYVVTVTKNQWDSYPEGLPITLKDGMLVRAPGQGEIYIISSGTKRWISGPALFEGLGYKWNSVVPVSAQTLDLHFSGDPVTEIVSHPDGTLVTSAGQGVALIAGGKRRPIPTPEIFGLQYQWKDIISIPAAEWSSYVEGDPVYYPEGLIFREEGDHKVYVVENGEKRWITSPVLFDNLGYKWGNIVLISRGASGGMAMGENLSPDTVGIAIRQ